MNNALRVQMIVLRAVSGQQTVVTALSHTVLIAHYMLPAMHALQVLHLEIQGSVSVYGLPTWPVLIQYFQNEFHIIQH